MNSKKIFYCDCVSWPADDANTPGGLCDMIDGRRQITYRTFQRHVGTAELREFAKSLGYGPWLHISKDYHVAYYRGRLHGKPVVWITHSAIEYVFQERCAA